MFKYVMTAAALKAFSCTRSTRRLYRMLGNSVGARKRVTGRMPPNYFPRMERMLAMYDRHGLLKNGGRLLELGTGWFHWEAMTTRLFYDIDAVLFDVWDNRQFGALKNFFGQLDGMLDRLPEDPDTLARAHALLAKIQAVQSWEQLYALLGFRYMVNESGTLEVVDQGSFDVVVSAGVMEHIHGDIAEKFVQGISDALKPGGYSFNSINIRDHLFPYDPSVSAKQYLRYGDAVWKCCFDNEVQYINRIQRSTWLKLFEKAGLELVEEEIQPVDISGLGISNAFRSFDEKDLSCGGLAVLHRKPF